MTNCKLEILSYFSFLSLRSVPAYHLWSFCYCKSIAFSYSLLFCVLFFSSFQYIMWGSSFLSFILLIHFFTLAPLSSIASFWNSLSLYHFNWRSVFLVSFYPLSLNSSPSILCNLYLFVQLFLLLNWCSLSDPLMHPFLIIPFLFLVIRLNIIVSATSIVPS